MIVKFVLHLQNDKLLRHLELSSNPVFSAFPFSLLTYSKFAPDIRPPGLYVVLSLIIAFIYIVAPKGAVLFCLVYFIIIFLDFYWPIKIGTGLQ